MDENLWTSFMDEIEKISAPVGKPTYPISRFLTSRTAGGIMSGTSGLLGLLSGVPNPGPVGGAIQGAGGAHLRRWMEARGTKGRMRKGGKALWGFEKKRLADLVGVSPQRLETLLGRIQKGSKGGKTFPISRLLTHSLLPPGNIPARFFGARAMAGRKAKGYKHFLKQEKDIIAALKKANRPGADIGEAASLLGSAAKKGTEGSRAAIGKLLKRLGEKVSA